MLDPKWVREHPELVKAAGQKKHMPCEELVDEFVDVDRELRRVLPEIEGLRAEQKQSGKAVGKASPEERPALLQRQGEIKKRIQELGKRQKELQERREFLLLRLPNPPADDVPEGKDESQNIEIRRHGEPPRFDFEPKDHVELGELHGLLDVPRAVKIAGSRNYFLRGDAVLLEEAVLRLALEHMVGKGFEPLSVPQLVREEAMYGTAYFPGGEEQAYSCEKDDLYLVGTAEVSLTAFHGDEILDPKELPRRYVARSSCYRREAGTYGKDTRGLYRVHQFQKVEQVVVDIADEAKSKQHHQAILENSCEIVEALELPYRVVNVCGGDLGQGQVQKFDIETWMPSRGDYGETHSASRFHEFQARRLKLRYRGEDGKARIAHTLNNTVVASPRILIALIENHQQADGSIAIPKALQPYFGREKIGG
ncbi:MAG: serine--tRNA ligase [Planctomycetota bacterium]|nr:MAG: serine--tRNA ligase [Planctomycetota bacterium]